MKKLALALLCLLAAGFFINTDAQKAAPAYKITKIKIVPFDQKSGEFAPEIPAGENPGFLNALDTSFFVAVEVSGQKDSFEAARKVQITVTEGKKLKAQRTAGVGYIGETGKVYVPIFLADTFCAEMTIKAQLIGQRPTSQMQRKLSFDCGE